MLKLNAAHGVFSSPNSFRPTTSFRYASGWLANVEKKRAKAGPPNADHTGGAAELRLRGNDGWEDGPMKRSEHEDRLGDALEALLGDGANDLASIAVGLN